MTRTTTSLEEKTSQSVDFAVRNGADLCKRVYSSYFAPFYIELFTVDVQKSEAPFELIKFEPSLLDSLSTTLLYVE